MTTLFQATRSLSTRLLLLGLCWLCISVSTAAQTTPRYAPVPASGPTPWFDIAAYGANVRQVNGIPSTTATTKAGSAIVTLSSAIDFKKTEGIVIWKAGASTTQGTPAAPTVTSPVVSGSTTYQYQCVGVDAMGGLTAASTAGQVTTGPTVLGAPQVIISSISQAGGVVTVNFSSAINASAGQQIIISDVTSPTTFNGLFQVARAPMGTQITYKLAGNAGAGTVSGNSKGRLVNAYNVTAISRTGNTVTVKTNANHNFLAPSITAPSIIIIDGVVPADLNGYFVVDSVTANTITYHMGMTGNETGTVMGTATVWEYNLVTCPAVTAPTVQYFVYGRTAGSMALIGKMLYKENTLRDYGPFLENGFVAPGYVPAGPPVSAQNQMFASTITAGAGTTTLTLAASAPSAVSGQTALHDDGQAIIAAANAAQARGSRTVYLSPGSSPTSPPANRTYIINAPFTLPGNFTDLMVGTNLIVNETVTLTSGDRIYAPLGSLSTTSPQFANGTYALIIGMGSPMFVGGQIHIERMYFDHAGIGGNGQNYIYLSGGHDVLKDDYFVAANLNSSVDIPLVFAGADYAYHLTNVQWSCNFAFDASIVGQPYNGPPLLPCILLEALSPLGAPNVFHLDGMNSANGRGILVDFSKYGIVQEIDYDISNVLNDQGPTNPLLAFYGQNNASGRVRMHDDVMDSHTIAVFANWSVGLHDVVLDGIDFSPQPNSPITGLPIPFLSAPDVAFGNSLGQNYDIDMSRQETGINFGPAARTPPAVMGQNYQAHPMRFSNAFSYPLYWQIAPPSGVTTSVSGAGFVPSGSHTYTVTAVGWNGGEVGSITLPVSSSTITVNGSQGVLVSWTGVTGVQGYTAYRDGGKVHNCINVSTTSCTDTVGFIDGAGPTADGTGLPLIDTTQVVTPIVRLTNGLYKVEFTASTLTANRQWPVPDFSPVSTTGTIASSTAVLGTSAIASNSCASTVTVAASGVLTTDVITWSFNADPNAVAGYGAGSTGTLSIWAFPTSGNVNFRVCNLTGGSITPGAAILNWGVVR